MNFTHAVPVQAHLTYNMSTYHAILETKEMQSQLHSLPYVDMQEANLPIAHLVYELQHSNVVKAVDKSQNLEYHNCYQY